MNLQDQILERLESDPNLPSMPSIVHKLMDLVANPDVNTDDIADVIACDPTIASRVLRLANSVAFAGASKVGSLDQAILRIGFSNIKDIVISMSVINLFKAPQFINYQEFWNHSLSVAFAAQTVERISTKRSKPSEELYMCGLLHDLGILLLDQFLADHYPNVLEEVGKYESELQEVERSILGVDHAQVGAILMSRWQLPQTIIDAVRCHHTPNDILQKKPHITKCVHIANFACNNQQIKNGIQAVTEKFSQSAWFDMKLSIADIPIIIRDVQKKVALASEILTVSKS